MDNPKQRGLLADALDLSPRQGPPEPDNMKSARLDRENEARKRSIDLSLKSPALDHLDDEQFLFKLKKLRKRLGIEDREKTFLSDTLLLKELLPEIQEFKRKGGRPRTAKSTDYERYLAVLRYRRENPSDKDCDDVTAIRQLFYGGHRLFAGHKENSLVISVSKGKSTWYAAKAELEELIANDPEAAKFFRKSGLHNEL